MRALLIPVKVFAESKKRLAPHVSPEARAELAAALCEDFFRVAAQVRGVERVYVVTQEPRALDWAQHNGWETIIETEQVSESHSVDSASQFCGAEGVEALLRIPIDLPLATPADIEAVLAEARDEASAVLVPSRDGTGTNALLRSPPTLFPSHFGPGSFALHLKEAERCGARVKILHNPNIELDVDEIEDFRLAAPLIRSNSATAHWIARYRL
jgi:2-phospho-L-lactate/phosphoenolpyruvate guanylyltransferase